VALGAMLLTSINSVLPSIGVSSVWVLAIDGILLLLAIAVDRVVALRVANVLRKRAAEARSAHHG
jgi:rhamnose transport system permease protein